MKMKTDLVFLGKHINVASQSRRRRLVVLIYVGLAALLFASLCGNANLLIFFFTFVIVARFLGGRSYRNGLVPPFMSGDEREMHRRDHANFLSYWWWDLALLPAMAAVGLKNNPFYPAWTPALRVFIDHLPYGLLFAAGILYYTLPQAILLWTEPDMEPAA
jgi:hypothetical protein